MVRILLLLLLFGLALKLIGGGSLGNQLDFALVSGIILFVIVKFAVDVFLFFRKQEEDRSAFNNVLHEERVESYSNLRDYLRRRRER